MPGEEKIISSESPHHQHANAFMISAAFMAQKFPEVEFDISNMTDTELRDFPGVIQAMKLDGQAANAKAEEADFAKAQKEALTSTKVFIGLLSNEAVELASAADALKKRAQELHGATDDTGTFKSKIGQTLEKVLGHSPQHEDAKTLGRYIIYTFV